MSALLAEKVADANTYVKVDGLIDRVIEGLRKAGLPDIE
jgi:hypothetical protein